MTPDEVAHIHTIVCPAHSELLIVDGMTTREVAEWARQHHACELAVVFADEPTLIPTVNTD